MDKNLEKYVFGIWFAVYIFIFIQTLSVQNQWTYDALFFSLLFLGLFVFRKWLKIQEMGLFLAGLGICLHLLGFYGLYQLHYKLLGYDSLTHFVSAFATSWIVFNFIIKKFSIRRRKSDEYFVGEHRLLFFILVLSVVSLLGVCVELVEFGGYSFLDYGDGMFFPGSGDEDFVANLPTGYADTMMDIITNLLGAFFGALIFYLWKYPKKKLSTTKV